MTKKKKQEEEIAEVKKTGQADPAPKSPDIEAEQPTLKSHTDRPRRPRRKGIWRRANGAKRKTPISTLASVTNTDSIVFAALNAAYGWTDNTKLTREEFLRLRDIWLNEPVREVKR